MSSLSWVSSTSHAWWNAAAITRWSIGFEQWDLLRTFFSKLLSRRFKLCVLRNPCQLKRGSLPWKPSCLFSQYIHNWMLKSKRKKENSKSFYAKINQLEVWWSKCCLSLTNSRTKGITSVFLFILLNNSFTSFLIAERKS